MKTSLIISLMFVNLHLFSQTVDVKNKKNEYKFKYENNIDEDRLKRYEFRIKEENVEIESISINNGKVSIIFKKETSSDRINKILLYTVTVLGYKNFNLK